MSQECQSPQRKLLPLPAQYCYLIRGSGVFHRLIQAGSMTSSSFWRRVGCAFCVASTILAVCLSGPTRVWATSRRQSASATQDSAKQSSESGPSLRIPRQQALTTAAVDGIVRDAGFSNITLPVPAAALTFRDLQTGELHRATASAEGIFRMFPLPPGRYELRVEASDYAAFVLPELTLQPNEVVTLEISLVTAAAAEARSRLSRLPDLGPIIPAETQPTFGAYREFRHRLDSDPTYVEN